MPLLVNLRHLEVHNVSLCGELPVMELDMETDDEMIRVVKPLRYGIEVQKLDGGLLVRGLLQLVLECHCVRCLKPFSHELEVKNWTCHLPFEGEDRVTVVNDCVDLTPFAREDMLLEFPQHPLCKPDCGGIKTKTGEARKTAGEFAPSAWAELDKLKL
ncbi:MAG TPA: YceD family protein [Candidatus Saccharimonadales bacterium]|nr:YceD family protein [Candidatus Saccharimonadales bacterium]